MTDLRQAVALHRQVAALMIAAGHAGVEHPNLAGVRARVAAQQPRLVAAVTATGAPAPDLSPSPGEIAATGASLGDLSPATIDTALRSASSTLDGVDSLLLVPPPGTSPVLRNALVYAGYAAGVVVLQLVLFFSASETTLPLLAPFCLLVFPAFAWLAGWVTIGTAFRQPGAGRVRRSARLGAAICLVPDLLLCFAVGALFVIDH